MEMMIKEIVITLFYAGTLGFVVILGKSINKVLDKIIDYVNIKCNDEELNYVLSDISKFTEESVSYVMQTYVDDLKKKGEFNKEQQENAFATVFSVVYNLISSEYKRVFEKTYCTSLEEYLKILIESKVKEYKNKNK